MSQTAWTAEGTPIDAFSIPRAEWEALKLSSTMGAYVMPCCKAPAVLKTSVNGLHFFAHLSDECSTAPETQWHQAGKAAVLAGLRSMGLEGRQEVFGRSPTGDAWEADVLFTFKGRAIAVELQRSYQHLREYSRRQGRYTSSGVECYWLVRVESFAALARATSRLVLERDFGNVWPEGGIGTGMLPELPLAVLQTDPAHSVLFGLGKSASMQDWLKGILEGSYRYRSGSWNLG